MLSVQMPAEGVLACQGENNCPAWAEHTRPHLSGPGTCRGNQCLSGPRPDLTSSTSSLCSQSLEIDSSHCLPVLLKGFG